MARQMHGQIRSAGGFRQRGAPSEKRALIVGLKNQSAVAKLTGRVAQSSTGLAFMFPQLQAPEHRLPVSAATVTQLQALAAAMAEPPGDPDSEASEVPAAYTYFGQFVDHDVSKIEQPSPPKDENLRASAALGPLADPLSQFENHRLAPLDLDSVYTNAPEDQGNTGKLQLGAVSASGDRPPGKDDFNDLPREGFVQGAPPELDRAAKIGDPRNDENLVVAQLHVAFLRAHNALVEELGDRLKAREELTRRYHEIIFTDFLPRIADLGVLNGVLANGRRIWNPPQLGDVPLEHSGAAYRFGHSMVRAAYDYNLNFGIGGKLIPNRAPFRFLFTFTALSGQLGGFPTLPENWVIQWERMAVTERARRIDTFITPAMSGLADLEGNALVNGMQILAERNLLRGYLFGLPTGQAVAGALGVPALAGQGLLDVLPSDGLKVAAEPFKDATPLWFYVLAEAGASGGRLGVVGSTIVVETLHALAQAAGAVFPAGPITAPSGKLLDLLRLSGNL